MSRFTLHPLIASAATLLLVLPAPNSRGGEDQARATLPAKVGEVLSVAFAPDGKTLACGCGKQAANSGGEIQLWDPGTGKLSNTLEGHTGQVNCVTFSADGKTLASASEDRTVRVWDTQTWKDRATLKMAWFPAAVSTVALNRDASLLASGDIHLRLWGPPGLTERAVFYYVFPVAADRRLREHSDKILSTAFSPDGLLLASSSWDGTVILWDVANAKQAGEIDDKPYYRQRGWKQWNQQNGKWLFTLRGPVAQVWSVVFTPDNKTLAAAYEDGSVVLWDMAAGKERARLRHAAAVKSIAIASDGTTLAAACEDGTVKLWDLKTEKELASIKAHGSAVHSVAFAPDGKTLATGGKEAKLWDVPAGK